MVVHIIKTTFLVNISLKTITISQSKSQTSNSDNLFIGDSLAVTVIVGVGGLCQKFPKRKLGIPLILCSNMLCWQSNSNRNEITIPDTCRTICNLQQFQRHGVFAIFEKTPMKYY